jgi:hypothetical protein
MALNTIAPNHTKTGGSTQVLRLGSSSCSTSVTPHINSKHTPGLGYSLRINPSVTSFIPKPLSKLNTSNGIIAASMIDMSVLGNTKT